MKIIIVTLYKGSSPFIDELVLQLNKKNIQAEVLDMIGMYTVSFADGKRYIQNHTNSFVFKKLAGIRFLGTVLRVLFYKRYLKQKSLSSEHISIHYALPYYAQFIDLFKKASRSMSVVIWGSDFMRISDWKRKSMTPLFEKCDRIVIYNTQMASDFVNFYNGNVKGKIRSVGFGIGKLELIKELFEQTTKERIKLELNIPVDKLVITIGYNGLPAQQHLLILDALAGLDGTIKNTIFILIPFGYGGDNHYKEELIVRIKSLDIGYHIYDSFISDVEVAKIRIATDIAINAQITDNSSASLQEHLCANNVLLVGDWLKYDHFKDYGLKFWSFGVTNLQDQLVHVLTHFDDYTVEVSENNRLIYEMSSWNNKIDQWVGLFENKL